MKSWPLAVAMAIANEAIRPVKEIRSIRMDVIARLMVIAAREPGGSRQSEAGASRANYDNRIAYVGCKRRAG